jgi:4-amino-4-deoxy-L-arabinose transferase-like glycosyltransferase
MGLERREEMLADANIRAPAPAPSQVGARAAHQRVRRENVGMSTMLLPAPVIAVILLVPMIAGSGWVAWRLQRRGKGPSRPQFIIQWFLLITIGVAAVSGAAVQWLVLIVGAAVIASALFLRKASPRQRNDLRP